MYTSATLNYTDVIFSSKCTGRVRFTKTRSTVVDVVSCALADMVGRPGVHAE